MCLEMLKETLMRILIWTLKELLTLNEKLLEKFATYIYVKIV